MELSKFRTRAKGDVTKARVPPCREPGVRLQCSTAAMRIGFGTNDLKAAVYALAIILCVGASSHDQGGKYTG